MLPRAADKEHYGAMSKHLLDFRISCPGYITSIAHSAIHGVTVFLLVELLLSCEVLEQHPSDVVTEILEEIMTYRP